MTVGQTVVLMTPEGSVTPAGFVPRKRRFTVAGIFESGMYEYDRGLALMHLSDAAKLYRLGDNVSGVRLALDDPFTAPRLVRVVAHAIDVEGYVTSTGPAITPTCFAPSSSPSR